MAAWMIAQICIPIALIGASLVAGLVLRELRSERRVRQKIDLMCERIGSENKMTKPKYLLTGERVR